MLRFGLFKKSFEYAVYVDINKKCKVLMYYPNDSVKVINYSFDAAIINIMNVSDILEPGDVVSHISESNGQKAKLRILTKKKSKRLRKG